MGPHRHSLDALSPSTLTQTFLQAGPSRSRDLGLTQGALQRLDSQALPGDCWLCGYICVLRALGAKPPLGKKCPGRVCQPLAPFLKTSILRDVRQRISVPNLNISKPKQGKGWPMSETL